MNENENVNNTTPDDIVDHIPEGAEDINKSTTAEFSFSSLPKPGTGFAVASLVLGIFSVLCCCTSWPSLIMAVVGLALGIYSYKKDPLSRSFAIVGIVLCGIGLALGVIICMFIGLGTMLEILGNGVYH